MKNIYQLILTFCILALPLAMNAQVTVNSNGELNIANPTNNDNFLSLNGGGDLYSFDIQDGDLVIRPNGSTTDATYSMKLYDTGTFDVDFYGKINLLTGTANSTAIQVDGLEAMWFNGTYFSWGFGGSHNYFADEISIGLTTPAAGMALHASGGDIRMDDALPWMILNDTGNDEWGGLWFRNDNTNEAYLYYRTPSNAFYFEDGATFNSDGSNNALTINLDLPLANATSDGYVSVGPITGTHLTMDNNELQAKGSATTLSDLYLNYWGGNTRINTGSTAEDVIIGNSNEVYVDNALNNVGIGTSSPTDKLHVVGGDIRLDDDFAFLKLNGTSGNSGVQFLENGTSEGYLWYRASDGDIILSNDFGGGGSHLVVDETGAIGIGTSTPDRALEVVGQVLISNLTSYPAAKQSTMLMRHYDQPTHFAYFKAQSSSTQNSVIFGGGAGANYAATSITFHTGETTTTLNGTERMRVRSDGRVRVGSSAFSYDFNVDGSAGKPGGGDWSTLSDRRVKTGIRKFEDGLEQVLKINPVFFQYKEGIDRNSGKEYVGIIAQEMQEVAPYTIEELEVEYEEGDKRNIDMESVLAYDGTAVRYMLVNAVKELAAENEKLKEDNETLNNRLDEIEKMLQAHAATINNNETHEKDVILNGNDEAYLSQNQPNPFGESTVIKYYLPEGTKNPKLVFFNEEGRLIKSINLDEFGEGQINLRANALPAGSYTYQLSSDEKIIGSKTMVLIQ